MTLKSEIEHDEGVKEELEEDIGNEKVEIKETELTTFQQLTLARGVIKYMVVIYLAAIGIGIDSLVFNLMLGLPSFRKRYGYWNEKAQAYVVEAKYQSGWNGGSQGTQIVGALISGQLSDIFGRLQLLRLACVVAIVAAVVEVTATSAGILVAGKCIMGLGTGILVSVVPPYLSELAPPNLRGYGAIGINFSICFGQFLAACTVLGCSKSYPDIDDSRGYKVSLSVQFILVSLFLIVSPLLPESPTLCVQRGNLEKARRILDRLYGDKNGYDKEAHFEELVAQVEKETMEHQLSKNISYLEVFKGIQFFRTVLCMVVLVGQQLVGCAFVLPYINYFFENAGISSSHEKTVGSFTVAVAGNLLSYYVLQKFPRRHMYIFGAIVLTICNLLTACMSYANSNAAGYVIVVFVFVWSFVYQFSIGPNAYAIMVEVPSSRLVAKTVSVASNVNSLVGFGLGYLIPYLYNPDEANLGLRIQFVWMGAGFAVLVFCLFFLPETMNRTAKEIDQMFEAHVSPMYFSKVKFTVDGDMIQSTAKTGIIPWFKRS